MRAEQASLDPRDLGCDCDACVLFKVRAGGPVFAEEHPGAIALGVGEAPGAREVEQGRPFVGAAGIELTHALAAVGWSRRAVSLTNTCLCRPPDNDLSRLMHQLQKENKAREKAGLPRRPTPVECCRPRLLAEVARARNVVTLGSVAFRAVTGSTASIMEARGGPREVALGEGLSARVLPTLHPAFVMRSRRWRGALQADLARALRWFQGGLAWQEPRLLSAPRPRELAQWLDAVRSEEFTVFDVETSPGFPEVEHFDPLHDRLRCLGIGTLDGRAVVVPFRSIESGGGSFYTSAEKPEIVALLRRYLTGREWRKAGWAAGYYDRMVCESQLGVTPRPLIDGILLHRVASPELPHNLGFSGSIYTDVDNWKAGHVATEAETDEQLWRYNATDCVVTAQVIPTLHAAVKARGQTQCVKIFSRLQDICVGLHRNGMPVDEERRREWDRRLLFKAQALRKKCRDLSGRPGLNPGSTPQLCDLLFEPSGWNLAPHHYTDLGEPSTDDEALRAFLSGGYGLGEGQRAFVQALREFRRTVKLRGTYVTRLRPIGQTWIDESILAWDEDEDEEERERRLRRGKGQLAPGLTLPDGRVHPDWNAQGTVGWRLSSSNPNAQNAPTKMRDMIVAPEGFVLVGCDAAQLELRMVAALAGAAHYLEAFARGEDPHLAFCLDFFGDRFRGADDDQKKRLRRFVKEATYAALYFAGVETIHSVLTSSEDAEERLLFPDLSIREVGNFHDLWLRRNPEIQDWWDREVKDWRARHYLAEPVFGLKLDLLDGEDVSRIVNYIPQSGGAALVHKACFRVLEEMPFEKWGPGTGLIQQGHDSLVVQVPEAEAERVARLMVEAMKIDGREYGLPVGFEGEAKWGKTWKEV